MPQIPWGTPTLSDSDKLEWRRRVNDDRVVVVDETQAQLKLLRVVTDDFDNLDNWTEVDAGGNVNLADGIVSLDGDGSWTTNGIYHDGVDCSDGAPTMFEIKLRGFAQYYEAMLGVCHPVSDPPLTDRPRLGRFQATRRSDWHHVGIYTIANYLLTDMGGQDPADWHTVRFYLLRLPECSDALRGVMITLEGGLWPNETVVYRGDSAAPGEDSLQFQVNRYRNDATRLTEVKEFRVNRGYDTGGEYMEFVADAGAGQVFGGLDWSNVDLPAGVTGTNLKYKTSYDDDPASYDGSWLTKTQLNDKGAISGNHRYIRLRVQLNSDGKTQAYGAAVNAADGISGVFAQPSAAIILTGNTVNAVAGTFDESARNTITANKVEDGHEYLHLGESAEGTLATGDVPEGAEITGTTPADGQVTLTIDAPNPTDVVYARYRKGGDGWSDEDESLKRTGDGDIVVGSLTNEHGYEFIVYVKSGSIESEWSDPAFATPTAGTTPAGLASLPLKYLRDTIAASSTFQGWVGAANAEEAKEAIHPVSIGTAEAKVTVTNGVITACAVAQAGSGYRSAPAVTVKGAGSSAEITATVAGGKVTGFSVDAGGTGYALASTRVEVAYPTKPWCLIDWADNFARRIASGGARNHFMGEGDLIMVYRGAVSAAHTDAEAAWTFLNKCGAIIADMEELAGTAGYLDIYEIARFRGPFRPDEKEARTSGDYYEVWYRVGWGSK